MVQSLKKNVSRNSHLPYSQLGLLQITTQVPSPISDLAGIACPSLILCWGSLPSATKASVQGGLEEPLWDFSLKWSSVYPDSWQYSFPKPLTKISLLLCGGPFQAASLHFLFVFFIGGFMHIVGGCAHVCRGKRSRLVVFLSCSTPHF